LKQSDANSISTCDNARCSWHPAVLPRCSKPGVATSVRRSRGHGFEPAEPGKHEPMGLVSVGVAQPLLAAKQGSRCQ
jgi:hypothetical protein